MNSRVCVDGIWSPLDRHCFSDLSSLPALLMCQDDGFGPVNRVSCAVSVYRDGIAWITMFDSPFVF